MKKTLITLLSCLLRSSAFAGNQLTEGFEYGNHDGEKPIGWTCDDNTWLCGYQEKDNNRMPHTGNWYAFTEADETWMFMPISLFQRMHYRFYCWAISDGNYLLEFWTGTSATSASMHTLLLSASVESGVYEHFSSYVETIPEGCDFIGIRAAADEGASCLTIDDIEIDMVAQYDFTSEAISSDTAMYPGSQGEFRYVVKNTGYDPLDITTHPSTEFFTDLSCLVNDVTGFTFHLEAGTSVEVVTTGTLRPEIQPGTVAWLDVMMTIPCGCNTSMVTFWVTPLDVTAIPENNLSISVYPNPTSDYVTIEAEDLQCVTLFDETGRTIKSVPANGNALQLDLTGLKAGTYFISAKTRSTSAFVKPILKM